MLIVISFKVLLQSAGILEWYTRTWVIEQFHNHRCESCIYTTLQHRKLRHWLRHPRASIFCCVKSAYIQYFTDTVENLPTSRRRSTRQPRRTIPCSSYIRGAWIICSTSVTAWPWIYVDEVNKNPLVPPNYERPLPPICLSLLCLWTARYKSRHIATEDQFTRPQCCFSFSNDPSLFDSFSFTSFSLLLYP